MSHPQESLVRRLAGLDSNLVSDVMDAGGLRRQALHHSMRPLHGGARIVGVVLCARGEPAGTSNVPSLSAFAIEEAVFPGCAVVIAYGGTPACSVIGGLMARSWQKAGCAGLVTDGLVRDSPELAELGFPVFAAGTTPIASGGRWSLVELGGHIHMPGADGKPVTLANGDLIIGDADGSTVLPARHAEAIITAAETLKEIEGRIVAMMGAGKSRREAFAANPRFDHVPRFDPA
jgi:4-hydroxy-4-methyl-2-oxoglutarate aldolase